MQSKWRDNLYFPIAIIGELLALRNPLTGYQPGILLILAAIPFVCNYLSHKAEIEKVFFESYFYAVLFFMLIFIQFPAFFRYARNSGQFSDNGDILPLLGLCLILGGCFLFFIKFTQVTEPAKQNVQP